jgi:hypothetical protein
MQFSPRRISHKLFTIPFIGIEQFITRYRLSEATSHAVRKNLPTKSKGRVVVFTDKPDWMKSSLSWIILGAHFNRSKHFLTTNCKSSKQTDRHQTVNIEAPWQIYCYSHNWPLRIPMSRRGTEGTKTHSLSSLTVHCPLFLLFQIWTDEP